MGRNMFVVRQGRRIDPLLGELPLMWQWLRVKVWLRNKSM
jgi:hypothetical protein